MGKNRAPLGTDSYERTEGTNQAVEAIMTKLGAPSRTAAVQDAVCFLGLLAKEASENGGAEALKKQVLHARAEFGVR